MDEKITFFDPVQFHFIHFIRWEWKFHKFILKVTNCHSIRHLQGIL